MHSKQEFDEIITSQSRYNMKQKVCTTNKHFIFNISTIGL